MPDYSILKSKLADPTFSTFTDEQIRTALNTKDIPVKQPISVAKIKAYLQLIDKRLVIKDSTDPAARAAEIALQEFQMFDVNDAAYLNKLTTILDNLVTAGIITTTDKTTILSLGDSLVSWAGQNWQGDVTLTDIVNARNYV